MVDRQRRAKLRTCGQRYQAKIETAREIIYKKGYVVNSKAVNDVIGSESFTPTRVSWADYPYKYAVADYFAECIHLSPFSIWAKLLLPVCCGSHA